MKKLILLLIISCCQYFILSADDILMDSIPENLKKDANAIVRYNYSEFIVNSDNNANYNVKYAITVFNKQGDRFANLNVYYDKFINVNYIKGRISDCNGDIIKKINNKDIKDRSATSGSTLYDNSRIKYYKVYEKKYPYTVEYEYSLSLTSFIAFPIWNTIKSYNLSVQNSEYILYVKNGYNFHYKTLNINKEPIITKSEKFTSYKWTAENLQAIKYEPYSPSFSEITPCLYAVPDNFYYDNYYGSQKSWEDYGKWIYSLIEGRDELSEKTKSEVQKLIIDNDNDLEKAKLVYEYMQSKTRYVSIQLGIGGFQPFTALEVDNTGYGDCKALSNYTKALLKEAGIKSYYTEIYGGEDNRNYLSDFVSTYIGNHIILCVPIEKDTIWLECTSQNDPFGYLGSFTDDRFALVITPEGGRLTKTKKYTQNDNLQIRTINAKLNENCSLNAKIKTTYTAIQYDNISYQLSESKEDQRKNLFDNLDLINFEIQNFEYTEQKKIIPEAIEDLDLVVNNYTSTSGKRMFIPLNLLNKHTYIPKKVENRNTEIVLNYAWSDYDTIIYKIPEKYKIEFLPDTTHIVSQFGEYKSFVLQQDNDIIYIRVNKRNEGRFPKEQYPELISFFKAIRKADRQKAILIEKL